MKKLNGMAIMVLLPFLLSCDPEESSSTKGNTPPPQRYL